MEGIILKNNTNIVKKTEFFDNLIRDFMSNDFVLTEDNINEFLNILHESDYELKYAHLYPVKTVNSVLVGGYFNPMEKEIAISVNALLNVSKDAPKEVLERYKLFVLVSYFHETRHEKQYDEVRALLNGNSDSSFAKIFCQEFLSPDYVYDPINSLMETDARLVSIQRVLDLDKKGVLKVKAESSYALILSLVQLLDGINVTTDKTSSYPNDPFSCNELMQQKIVKYKNMIYKDKHIDIHSPEFYEKFNEEYNAKFMSFFKNEYSYLIKMMFFNTKILNSTKINILLKYRINTQDRESWAKMIRLLSYRPVKELLYDLLTDRYYITKDKNDINATHSDIEEYFKYKNWEFKKENEAEFTSNIEKHKEFEKWLRAKYRQKKKQKINHSPNKPAQQEKSEEKNAN